MSKKDDGPLGFTVSQWRLFIIVLVIGLSAILFHALQRNGIANSAALYVGLPFLFALGLSLTPKTKSTMGATLKGLTIALLLSAPLFMEGFICILMASPILYSVAALYAWVVGRAKRAKDLNSKVQLSALTLLLAFASLEGTNENLTFDRSNQVEYSSTIDADIAFVRKQLAEPSIPSQSRPAFLKVFPLPVDMSGQGIDVGDERHLDFVYKKWFFSNVHKGSTIFRVAESRNDYIRFDIPHDDSYISHYLTWTASEVFLEPTVEGKTNITWRLGYERKLDPIWYFGPMQNYAAWLTAKVLVENTANAKF
ncbi:MAG: hypothetical protein ACI93R_004011 [Flavobacteriales bacterium]|jgi:hypothetical protein